MRFPIHPALSLDKHPKQQCIGRYSLDLLSLGSHGCIWCGAPKQVRVISIRDFENTGLLFVDTEPAYHLVSLPVTFLTRLLLDSDRLGLIGF